jgi:hypothetical protein
MTASVIPLPFKGDLIDYLELHGRKLEWLWRDHEAYVPVRPICDQLNIDWKSQYRKLTAPDYEGCVVMMTTQDTIGRDQEMLCIAYPDFLIWLATLTISRLKPAAQDAARRTKAEIKQVLSNYYRERLLGEAVAIRRASRQFEDACGRVSAPGGQPCCPGFGRATTSRPSAAHDQRPSGRSQRISAMPITSG